VRGVLRLIWHASPSKFTGQQSARVKSPESTERASDRGLDDRSSWRQRILVPARCLDQAGVIPISPPDFPGTTHCDMVSAFWPATQDGPGGGGFFDGQIGLLGLRYLVIFLFEVYSTMPPCIPPCTVCSPPARSTLISLSRASRRHGLEDMDSRTSRPAAPPAVDHVQTEQRP